MVIRLEDVSVAHQGRTVLAGVTARIAERRVAVIGANGSGKSTFARLLNGLVQPDAGRVEVDGLDARRDVREVRRRVGFVFQNPDNQIVFPIVAEDMAFGLKNQGLPRAEIPARVAAELARFGLSHLAERPSHTLSGGEKQLVAMASVLVMRPRLVVFDEPTTLLDLRNRNRIRDAIAGLEQGALVVTHDLDLVADFERVLVIAEGGIACDAPPPEALRWYRERMA